MVETGGVRKYYSEEFANALLVRPLLQAMGFMGYLAQDRFPDSFLAYSAEFDTLHLPAIDGDALLAAYGRLEPGTEPEDLSPESLGPWSDTSFHLRGDMTLAGGQAAAFGVALRNGLVRPWAFGPEPLASVADNTALFGTVTWNGALAGITPEEETVAGDARLAVEFATLEGQLDFTDLERWGVRAAPGASGSGTTWGGRRSRLFDSGGRQRLRADRGRRRRGHRRVLRPCARGDGRGASAQRSERGVRRDAVARVGPCGLGPSARVAQSRRLGHSETRLPP